VSIRVVCRSSYVRLAPPWPMATVPWGPYGACRRDFADEEGELQTAGLKGVRSLASNGTQAKEERDVGIGRRAPGSSSGRSGISSISQTDSSACRARQYKCSIYAGETCSDRATISTLALHVQELVRLLAALVEMRT
jgi:hypothetical protein